MAVRNLRHAASGVAPAPAPAPDEVRRLQAALASLTQERDTLKEALHETGHGAMESLAKASH